jgi:diguanylate cyclase (GGDEF)-like protein
MEAELPAADLYLAAFAFIYSGTLFLLPRVNDFLTAIIPLPLVADFAFITLFIMYNSRYVYALAGLYMLPVIALSFQARPFYSFFGALLAGSLYLAIAAYKGFPLPSFIVQVIVFFITAFFTQFLVNFVHNSYFQQANQDTLTKIHNRRYFNHILSRMVRTNVPFSLILLDIDNFKMLNDTQGHHHGDYVLKVIASILKECTRVSDVVARFGGDEFAIILPQSGKETAKNIAERIRNNVLINPKLLLYPHISLSLGIASFPEDASNEEDILKRADEALYRSKGMGKNYVSVYTPSQ